MKTTHTKVSNRIPPIIHRLELVGIKDNGNGVFDDLEDGSQFICPINEEFVIKCGEAFDEEAFQTSVIKDHKKRFLEIIRFLWKDDPSISCNLTPLPVRASATLQH